MENGRYHINGESSPNAPRVSKAEAACRIEFTMIHYAPYRSEERQVCQDKGLPPRDCRPDTDHQSVIEYHYVVPL